jgi:predicted ATPase
MNEYVALNGGANKFLHKGQKITDSIFFKVKFKRNAYAVFLSLGLESEFVVKYEDLFYGSNINQYKGAGKESILKDLDAYRAEYTKEYLEGLRKYHFHDTSSNSDFTKLSHIENDIHYLYGEGGNLAAFLYEIQQSQKIVYKNIVKTIQSIAPYFSDFFLIPNTKGYVRLQWTDKYSDVVFGVSDLSDGTLRFIALTVLFMQPNLPNTIIIDEPELGLHPSAIAKLAGMIKSVSKKGSQVILATQSTDLISHFEPHDIITVDQINGESKFTRLKDSELEQWLEDYTLDDLWKRNIITTGQPNF